MSYGWHTYLYIGKHVGKMCCHLKQKKDICVYNVGYAEKRLEHGIENSVLNARIMSQYYLL